MSLFDTVRDVVFGAGIGALNLLEASREYYKANYCGRQARKLLAAIRRGSLTEVQQTLHNESEAQRILEARPEDIKEYWNQHLTSESIPLCLAVKEGHIEIVKELIAQGASVNLASMHAGYGWPALHWALENRHKNHPEISKLLLAAGADVNTTPETGDKDTPLWWAIASNKPEIVRLLLERGADPNQGNRRGGIPLDSAVRYNYSEKVRLLIAHGADVRRKNKEGKTPLDTPWPTLKKNMLQWIALYQPHVELTPQEKVLPTALGLSEVLLDRELTGNARLAEITRILQTGREDVDQLGFMGATPLYWAAQGDMREIVQLLINYGADIHKRKNGLGNSPYDVAPTYLKQQMLIWFADSQQKKQQSMVSYSMPLLSLLSRYPGSQANQLPPEVIERCLDEMADACTTLRNDRFQYDFDLVIGKNAIQNRLNQSAIRVAQKAVSDEYPPEDDVSEPDTKRLCLM